MTAARRLPATLVLCAGALWPVAAPPAGAQRPTVVIVVRHAERAAVPRADPALAPAGQVRARDLAVALAAARVDGVIVTQYQRTRLTASPLADDLGLTPVVVTAGGAVADHARAVADTVRQRFAGRAVLVVGHSNTVGPIIAALGGPPVGAVCDNAHADLFVLVLRAPDDVTLIHSRYGAEDPPPPPDCGAVMRRE